jgi:hypothetical protein
MGVADAASFAIGSPAAAAELIDRALQLCTLGPEP